MAESKTKPKNWWSVVALLLPGVYFLIIGVVAMSPLLLGVFLMYALGGLLESRSVRRSRRESDE